MEDNKPKFLTPDAEDASNSWHVAGGDSAPTSVASSTAGLHSMPHKHKKVAELISEGKSIEEISAHLESPIDVIKKIAENALVRREVLRLADVRHAGEAQSRLENLTVNAVDVMEKVLRDPDYKDLKHQESAARWVIEKVTGKPGQSIDIGGDMNVSVFLNQLNKMDPKDVTSQVGQITSGVGDDGNEIIELDPIASWVEENT